MSPEKNSKPLNFRPQQRDMKFKVFIGKDGQHYIKLLSSNGQTVLVSEGYTQCGSAKDTLTSTLDAIKAGRYSVEYPD